MRLAFGEVAEVVLGLEHQAGVGVGVRWSSSSSRRHSGDELRGAYASVEDTATTTRTGVSRPLIAAVSCWVEITSAAPPLEPRSTRAHRRRG